MAESKQRIQTEIICFFGVCGDEDGPLMENQSKAACWPEMENVKMCNYVHLQALFG